MKIIFSAVISIILLGIYVRLVWLGVDVVLCVGEPSCTVDVEKAFNDRMASSLALIGGLVSALVIAELSVTKPGELPAARLVGSNVAGTAKLVTQCVTTAFLIVWLVTGLTAFVIGFLGAEPGVLPPLADLGQAWLGIAVGAGYAYFGIKS